MSNQNSQEKDEKKGYLSNEQEEYLAQEQQEVDFLNKLIKENNIQYFIIQRLNLESLNRVYQGYKTPLQQYPDGKTPKLIFKLLRYHSDEEKEKVKKVIDIFDLFPEEEDTIIRVIDSFELMINDSNHIFLVSKFYEYSDLYEFFKVEDMGYYVSETEICYTTFQILRILLLLKRENVLHNDIKLENFIVMNKIPLKIGIIDFDFSEKIESYSLSSEGTPIYMAPEVINHGKHNFQSDIWSLGINLFLLMFKCFPFEMYKNSREAVKFCLDNCELEQPYYPEIKSNVWNCISRMLEKDPNKRITVEEALKHPWFKYMKFPTIKSKHKAESIYLKSMQTVQDDDDEVKKSFVKTNKDGEHNKSRNKNKDKDKDDDKNDDDDDDDN